MTTLIIDVAVDVTATLPELARQVRTVFGYMSSINPAGPKCLTPARARAIAAAGLRMGLVHEGWGGAAGHGGISRTDGERDGAYCVDRARALGAPKGACIYFACDTDFSAAAIQVQVLPYFTAIRKAFDSSLYRVGVYGSGAVCEAVIGAGLADLSWEAQSRGWSKYSDWLKSANQVQGPETKLDGVDVDTDTAQGDIGDFIPFAEAPPIVPATPWPRSSAPAPSSSSPPSSPAKVAAGDGWLDRLMNLLRGA